MFVRGYSTGLLRSKRSVITRETRAAEVLAADDTPLADVALRAAVPGSHKILVPLPSAFPLLLVWGGKLPSYGGTETR